MESLGVTYEELDITETARLMLRDLGHPFSAGEPVYDVTFENVQAGLRTDYLFRVANQHGGIVLGTGDLSELALGWCTYGVGDQMSHYNVNAGVPKTLIQHLIRWVAIIEAVRRRGQRGAARRPRHRDHPRARAHRRGRGRCRAPRRRSAPTRCRTSPCSTRCATASARRRSRSWRCTPGATSEAGDWPPGFPADKRRAYDLAEIRHWLEVFAQRFFAFSQFKRSALPNGPKVSPGGSLSPRGDWRAPSDLPARIWLEEIRTQVPDA